MADTFQIFMKLFGIFVTFFLIYIVIAGAITLALYTRVGQGDPKGFWYTDRDKLKKYIFKSWIDWAGMPSTFSYLTQHTPLSYSLYKKLTTDIPDCMLQCEAANDRGKKAKCVGFVYESNTCHLASTMDGLVSSTSNTVYFIDGLDTARSYILYTSNTQADATFIAGSPYTKQNDTECLSNCASQSECTGVIFSEQTCGLSNNLVSTKFTSTTGKTIQYLTTHKPLLTSNLSYYSTT